MADKTGEDHPRNLNVDAASVDAASEDAASGEAASGDAVSGHAASGHAATGHAATGVLSLTEVGCGSNGEISARSKPLWRLITR